MIDTNVYLSPHFTLREMIRSGHHTIDNTPSDEVLAWLTVLCGYLEKIRLAFGALEVTSGYRCPELNAVIGGAGGGDVASASASAHMFGCAADLFPLDPLVTVTQMTRWVASSNLDYDQIVDEGTASGTWMHFGLVRPGHELLPRHEALVMRGGAYYPFS
jgi:zinc D-Ala-D-Ala carboxypeptidase